jgi:nicotinamide-nucleotide amidase
MRAQLLAIGTELLAHRQDTNSLALARRLRPLGIETERRLVLPDKIGPVVQALRVALRPGILVVCSGGLGPTSDDVTRQAVAQATQRALEYHPELMRQIEARFQRRQVPMPVINRVQALIPRGAIVLPNAQGTAPGFLLSSHSGWVAALPGPPAECLAMFEAELAPAMRRLRLTGRPQPERWLRICGLPEAQLMMLLAPGAKLLADWGVTLDEPGESLIRINGTQAALAAKQRWLVRVLGQHLVGTSGQSLEAVVGGLLRHRGETLAVAESCTGGRIAGRLTSVPGSSAYFLEGVVAYANRSKTRRLGVLPAVLERWGAVSAAAAVAMAQGARQGAGADWGLATTGIAGPTGGSVRKPVGLVYIGLAGPRQPARAFRLLLGPGERGLIQRWAATLALNELRLALRAAKPSPRRIDHGRQTA